VAFTQANKAQLFQELHQREKPLLVPNPWDIGSTRVLTLLGFKALATSSGASATSMGRRDGRLARREALAHARGIVDATDLPVSADLENGFGHEPAFVAQTILLAAETGLVGASIEDSTGTKDKPLYDIGQAVERVAAVVEAVQSLRFPFTLTARSENFFRGNANLDNTIERLIAYEKAGADVLFASALPDLTAVHAVCGAVSKPVNFMVGIKGKSFTVAELAGAGVKRISFASSFYRAAMTVLVDAAHEVKEKGTFNYLDHTLTTPELNRFLPE
jgi:2-methylisocitrate lyase-like PEP mutase family enzyme